MFVGIDVSKDMLDVYLRPSGQAFTVPRDSESIENLARHLSTLEPELVMMEATGGFETVAAAGLAATDLPLAVVNPTSSVRGLKVRPGTPGAWSTRRCSVNRWTRTSVPPPARSRAATMHRTNRPVSAGSLPGVAQARM